MKNKDTLGLITARGGSKGIPGKNIKPLAGKPLIGYTIESAINSGCLHRIIVSSDDNEIIEISRRFGAEVPFVRPRELARDDSSHIETVIHAVNYLNLNENYHPDFICLLQPTSPLRSAEDIKAAVEIAIAKDADAVISINETENHPVFLRTMREDGQLNHLFYSETEYERRQDLSSVYFCNGAIYIMKTETLFSERTFYPAGSYGYVMPKERSIDIDDLFDFHLAELIISNR